jgi:hypothetical protein
VVERCIDPDARTRVQVEAILTAAARSAAAAASAAIVVTAALRTGL